MNFAGSDNNLAMVKACTPKDSTREFLDLRQGHQIQAAWLYHWRLPRVDRSKLGQKFLCFQSNKQLQIIYKALDLN